ncbi:hypothetical protein L2E82_17214 [Cichorium intybus]|uniref:Uncharacterized protein n=1 Tax=Cichorium intybus TaxID=13427 RepID=A0ACB9F8B9_CICIN|nr:hypothetical protein L2E82_17214 [Cichorium intybus]
MINLAKVRSTNRVQIASTSNSLGLRHILPGLQVDGSDVPIARRVSLQKFLEKRKDRATRYGAASSVNKNKGMVEHL